MRLTEKRMNNYAVNKEMLRVGKDVLFVATELADKLGQLEDIEEKLGIDLITYIKLVQNGFFGICEDDEHDKHYVFEFLPRDFVAYNDEIVVYWQCSEEEYTSYQYKDYGKTWALTKEELL